MNFLSIINPLGPDLEYVTNSELSINSKAETDEYYVKKYHQEFWSGSGIASLLFWVPFYLKPALKLIILQLLYFEANNEKLI